MGHSLSKESQLVLKAASKGHADLLERYLSTDPGLIKSVTLLKRSSILHLAAREGYPDIINACLQPFIAAVRREISTDTYPGPACHRLRKVINSRDVYYRTPLIIACKRGHLNCVKVVVERAANLFAIDRDANTCLHYAALKGHADVVEYLMLKTRSRDLLERFINKRNICGFSALHYAVWRGHTAVVQLLLQYGADTSHANDRVFDPCVPVPIGSTPMHLAVVQNNSTIVLMLLEHYAMQVLDSDPQGQPPSDPRSATNLYGLTPAQLAAHMRNRTLARLLLPGMPITSLFTRSELSSLRSKGLMPLKALASQAWQQHLLGSLTAATAMSAVAAADAAAAAAPSANAACMCSANGSTPGGAEACSSSSSSNGYNGAEVAPPGDSSTIMATVSGSSNLRSTAVARFSSGVTTAASSSLGALGRLVHMVQGNTRALMLAPRSTSDQDCGPRFDSTAAAVAAVSGAGSGVAAPPQAAPVAAGSASTLHHAAAAVEGCGAAVRAACGAAASEMTTAGSTDLEIVCVEETISGCTASLCRCSSSSSSSRCSCVAAVRPDSGAGVNGACSKDLLAAGASSSGICSGCAQLEPACLFDSCTTAERNLLIEEIEVEACAVCLDAAVNVALVGCGHGMCSGCAEKVVMTQAGQLPAPPLCPFCRSCIKGFQAHTATSRWSNWEI